MIRIRMPEITINKHPILLHKCDTVLIYYIIGAVFEIHLKINKKKPYCLEHC